jgi:hypothetical protein
MSVAVPARSIAASPAASCLRVDLGETVAELHTPDAHWLAHLKERFRGFLTSAPPHLVLRHEPDRAGPPVEVLESGVEIRLNAGARTEFVDGALRTQLPELAAPALVAHGALLTDGARGFLCCGFSGAGKTTLAALLPERALCDELALVRAAAGGFEGVSLPYWTARPGCAPLAGVFLLEHAPEHRRWRLAPVAAARALRAHIYWPTRQPAALRGAFATLAGLTAAVPVWRLGFARDPGVWRTIAEAA